MFKCKVINEFRHREKMYTPGTIILVPEWLLKHLRTDVQVLGLVQVHQGFFCAMKTKKELIGEGAKRVDALRDKADVLELRYKKVIKVFD